MIIHENKKHEEKFITKVFYISLSFKISSKCVGNTNMSNINSSFQKHGLCFI